MGKAGSLSFCSSSLHSMAPPSLTQKLEFFLLQLTDILGPLQLGKDEILPCFLLSVLAKELPSAFYQKFSRILALILVRAHRICGYT